MVNAECLSTIHQSLFLIHVTYAAYLTCVHFPHSLNPSHAAIKISINATAAEFICKNIFPTPVQVKKIIKNKTGDIEQIYLYQNVCK